MTRTARALTILALATGLPAAARAADALMVLQPGNSEPKILKASALERLAQDTDNAPSRNYYLEYAQMLRRQAVPPAR